MSRPKERIIPFLEFIRGKFVDVIYNIYRIGNIYEDYWEKLYEKHDTNLADLFYDSEEEIKKYWLENPDLRFSQVLVNLGIIPNIPGFWYYIEEDEILEKLGIPAREYLLWGQNYDKDMNLLPKTLYKPIKDLATDHIQAILDGGYAKNPKYIKYFEEELKLRNGNTTNSTETT